jgi:hypothetical protein
MIASILFGSNDRFDFIRIESSDNNASDTIEAFAFFVRVELERSTFSLYCISFMLHTMIYVRHFAMPKMARPFSGETPPLED